MPRSKTIALMFALCACVITGFLAHHLYENHLSSEFRRVLIAANDEHETPFDQTSYLHEARLAVRTRKDQQVLEQFERADALGTKSNNALSRIAQEMSIESDYVKKVSAIIDAERASVSANQNDIEQQIQDVKTREKQESAKWKLDRQTANEQYRQSLLLFRTVRSELGLPEAAYLKQ